MISSFCRDFPLKSIQNGAPLGNGLLGFLLWGSGRTLHITIGCANLWDHRGGLELGKKQNFKDIRAALEACDQTAIDTIFAPELVGTVTHPSLIPVGRVDLTLPVGGCLQRYELNLCTGVCTVFFNWRKKEQKMAFCCDMSCKNGLVVSGLPAGVSLKLLTSYEIFRGVDFKKDCLCEHNSLEEHGFRPPEEYSHGTVQAFCQPMPADESYSVLLRTTENEAAVSLFRGDDHVQQTALHETPDFAEVKASARNWWNDYWKRVPTVCVDHELAEELYCLGMYKYGVMTNPAGAVPGLQGPWLEDDRLPPWQGDYHFNINAQLINGPGLKAGLADHLKPLFDMIFSWKEKLRKNAEAFVGIEDGYMMPHAVDDRGTCMGSFWEGTIDHASSAWMAQMMYEYCDICNDVDYLRDKVFDFMRGTMRVFQQMIERKLDGSLVLPVSVSPEYRDNRIDAWGVNSSFQLAAIHRLARNLLAAAKWLNVEPEPFWQDVEDNLPLCSLYGEAGGEEIALWEGLPIRESHRHHSHLGGLVPFDVLNCNDSRWNRIINTSITRWIMNGMGQWTGWCVPWASQIYSRIGYAEAAVFMLENWRRFFNNYGGASLHDAEHKGLSFIACIRGEIMQIDGACGAVTAVQDMLAHSAAGELHFFYGIPKDWKIASFRNLCLPGAIRASGRFEKGRTLSLTLVAERAGDVMVRTADAPEHIIRISLQPGIPVMLKNRRGKLEILQLP